MPRNPDQGDQVDLYHGGGQGGVRPGGAVTRAAAALLAAALAGTAPAAAQPQAAAKLTPPEICDVAVALEAGSGRAVVTWSGGTPPFQVVRGNAPRFDRASELDFIGERVTERRFVDARPRPSGGPYYYQVYDFNSARELFAGPDHAHPQHGHQPDTHDPPPDNNYCKGVLRRPVTWK